MINNDDTCFAECLPDCHGICPLSHGQYLRRYFAQKPVEAPADIELNNELPDECRETDACFCSECRNRDNDRVLADLGFATEEGLRAYLARRIGLAVGESKQIEAGGKTWTMTRTQ